MTYDNGLPMGLEEFENLSYARRNKFLEWMKEQKRIEKEQNEA